MTHTIQALALTLIHFCWQAAAIAVVYRGLSQISVRCSSSTRYALALCALLFMAFSAIATFAYEMQGVFPVPVPAATAFPLFTAAPFATVGSGVTHAAASSSSASSFSSIANLPALPLPLLRGMVGLWLLGVLTLSLRSLGGWWLIQRLRRTATVEAPAAVRASFRSIATTLGIRRPVLLRVHSAISGPVTVGALRALVLLPLSAATSLSPDQLEVVLAHELAHVRRADFFWNLVQTLVETLFFFHPAVWWIGSRIRHERELCCDDIALSLYPNPVVYANALFQLEQQRSRGGQLAMALDGHQTGLTLRTRIARILGEPLADASDRAPFSLVAAAAVLIALLLPVQQVMASLKPAPAAAPSAIAAVAPAPVIHPVARSGAALGHLAAVATVARSEAPALRTPVLAIIGPQQSEPETSAGKGDYIDRMKAAGYDVDLDRYIAMKIQGVTPEYARSMSELGFGKLSADDLVACKVQGVTPEYIASLKQNGFEVKTVQDAISYHIFQLTPEFVAAMKAAGFSGLSTQQLLTMRVQGITPEYARSIAQMYPGATADDLVKTRIFNIDAAFIASAKKHGFTDLTLEKLVKLRISGILDDEDSK